MMLDSRGMDALARLSQRKGALDHERVEWIGESLIALGQMPADVPAEALVSAVLRLCQVEEEAADDLMTLVTACQGNSEAVAHAQSLLDMAVRMQPSGRRPRRATVTEPQQFSARVVGQ